MKEKRVRSLNWDEQEKQILLSVLKEYVQAIENKSLDTNTNKIKSKAWEEIYKKFNKLNCRHRRLTQLKIQWKAMKISARKSYRALKIETNKIGGEARARPTSPNNEVIEVRYLLNAGELLKDHKTSDLDEINSSTSEKKDESVATSNTCTIKLQVPQQTQISNNIPGSSENELGKELSDYSIISYSKMLKDKEHVRHMEMAEEEHAIKMAIHKEKLRCAILEREILEFKKAREMQS